MRYALLVSAAAATLALSGCAADATDVSEGEDELKSQPTVLVVPLMFQESGELITSQAAELKKAGKGEFPEVIEFTAKNIDQARDEFSDAVGRVSEYASDLYDADPSKGDPDEMLWAAASPSEYVRKAGPSICYRGNPKGVADILTQLGDGVLSDQFTMWGWRYKSTKTFEDGFDDSSFGKEWSSYDTKGTDVLIVNSAGDDGTDENSSLIPRCPSPAKP